jgi:hypothetical protein
LIHDPAEEGDRSAVGTVPAVAMPPDLKRVEPEQDNSDERQSDVADRRADQRHGLSRP